MPLSEDSVATPTGVDPNRLRLDGRPIYRSHERLRALIGGRLSESDAALLAVPLEENEGLPRWRPPGGGALVSATTLAPKARAALEARRKEIVARIKRLATALEGQGEAGQVAAQMIRLALVTPEGASCLYAEGEQPVLVAWGMAAPGQDLTATAEAQTEIEPGVAEESPLPGTAPRQAPVIPAAAALGVPAESTAVPGSQQGRCGAFWLAWLLPVLLALLLAWLLWRAWLEPRPVVEVVTPRRGPRRTRCRSSRLAAKRCTYSSRLWPHLAMSWTNSASRSRRQRPNRNRSRIHHPS